MEAIGEVGQLLAHEGSGWHELIAESRRLIVASRLNPAAGKQRWRAVRLRRSTGKKIGDAWGITGKAYVDRTTAALRYYGLLEYQGVGKERE